MMDRPGISDERITACLYRDYGLSVNNIQFLPLGQDSHAGVFRVESDNGTPYFLKVRRGSLYEPAFLVPRFLKDNSLPQAVAPLSTRSQGYSAEADGFHLILYPYIEGNSGLRQGMTDAQWTAFGSCIRALHSTPLPPEISEQIPRENFVSTWLPKLRALHEEVLVNDYTDSYQRELASFWHEKSREIEAVCNRVTELEWVLQNATHEMVLCHADIHTGNILLDTQGGLHIVDWDQPLLAPKERDLMFVGGGIAELATPAQVEAFYRGYGDVEINPAILAYYRYEWAVQDMGDFSARVFLWEEMGDETKRESIDFFRSLFEPGRVIDTARRAEARGR